MLASFIFGLIALIGTIVTTAQALLTRRFRKTRRPFAVGLPSRQAASVSILKPVCGLDDELEENLASFARLTGIDYEVIISVDDAEDPALPVVRRVLAANAAAPFRLVIEAGSRTGVVNRKVERLIAAERVARGEILFISDSNVRVEPDAIAATLREFADRKVGCVSNLFTGARSSDTGSTIESLHLLGFVVPGAVLAACASVPCVVGKSMAISRVVLRAIGGFERFRSVLAEDQAIGLAVRAAGFDVVLSPIVVRNIVVRRTIAKAVGRQVRWNKIRYAFSRSVYFSEVLINPLPWAVLAAVFAPLPFLAFPILVAASRVIQMALLNRATRAGLTLRQLLLTPLLDFLMLSAWLVPFFSNRVTWRGYEARIGRNTELVERAA